MAMLLLAGAVTWCRMVVRCQWFSGATDSYGGATFQTGPVYRPHAGAVAVLVFLWEIASFALVPPLQVRVMTAAADATNLASAVNIGAFNLGNAIGAALGEAVIAGELGFPAVALAGAATSSVGLLVLLLTLKRSDASANGPLCGA